MDKRAGLTPGAIVYSGYPIPTLTYDEGYSKVTYRDYANSVNGATRWLQTTLGPGHDYETLAYIGPNDLRYPALILSRTPWVRQFNTIDWIHIDRLLEILFELAREQRDLMHYSGSARVFHPANPQLVSYKALRDTAANELQSQTGNIAEIILLRIWISRVRKNVESKAGDNTSDKDLEMALRANSAVILRDIYYDLLALGDVKLNKFNTTKIIRSSKKLREIKDIKDKLIRKWIREWTISRKGTYIIKISILDGGSMTRNFMYSRLVAY